jgi:hypothetical protein
MWRAFYNMLGWEYMGRREREQIERQKRLKYLSCEQVKKSNVRLKPIKIKFLERLINKKNKNRK